jgi:hypothetical protein
MGASSSVATSIKNYNVNKSDLEVMNQQVNEFVSNSVTTAAASCGASSSLYVANKIGDIRVVGKKNKAKIGIDTEQDAILTFQCIQESIQKTDVSNEMAQSIMNNLSQTVDTQTVAKLMQEAEAKNTTGAFAPPWGSASSEVNVNVETTNINDTKRKLSNLVSNSVANNVSNDDIKECFAAIAFTASNEVGKIDIFGEENEFELSMSSKQISKSFATCQQLTQQTSAVTTAITTALGLTIIDDTKIKNETESESKATAVNVVKGVDSIIDSLGNLLGLGFLGALAPILIPISSISSCICCLIIIIFLIRMGGSKKSNSGEQSSSTSNSGQAVESSTSE